MRKGTFYSRIVSEKGKLLYDNYKRDLVNRKMDFTVQETTYSRKIKMEDYVMIFNSTGRADDELLALVNKTRKDARQYMENNQFKPPYNIRWFDLIDDIPTDEEAIFKVDIRSAYWQTALKMGVISSATNDYWMDACYGRSAEYMKSARLKALGSLATTKRVQSYENGVRIPEKDEVTTEKTKVLYMYICKKVDEVMRECAFNIPGCFFYYWDCIFTKASHVREVIDFFKKHKYDTLATETRVRFLPWEKGGQLLSISDDKMYMVPQNRKHLISNIQY